jgi:hypothetical protein
MSRKWQEVKDKIDVAVSIAWDGCHKIYVLMDEKQHEQMEEYGYDPLIRIESIGTINAYETVKQWYDNSCMLKFVNAVKTVEGDPNDGYIALIPQG